MIELEIDNKGFRRLLTRAPKRLGVALGNASVSALARYRGFHRRRRMSRKSTEEGMGIFATRGGLKQDRFFSVKPLGKTLETAGAEIVVRNQIIVQLERGATISKARPFPVPFSKSQARGKPKPRVARLLRQRKLIVIRGRGDNVFLGERRGRGKSARTTLHFHFQRRIVIPPRLGFEKTFGKDYRPNVFKALNQAMRREIQALNRGRR